MNPRKWAGFKQKEPKPTLGQRISGRFLGTDVEDPIVFTRLAGTLAGATVGGALGARAPVAPGPLGFVINPFTGAFVGSGVGSFLGSVAPEITVEAGEKLGFLPGALEEKVDPYMQPVWDALNETLGPQEVERRKERKEIEVVPLAFMRGRTLKTAFVVIDEAQNATITQMKMVLTRLGRGSRMVVTGDPSQSDLDARTPSGLAHAMGILDDVEGVSIRRLTARDVVRHEMVARVIAAYDRAESVQGRRP
mgnify:CR=1 FL=1